MNSLDFETSANAKCILAGEHAVIRGYPALVSPILSKSIVLKFQSSPQTPYSSFSDSSLLSEIFGRSLQQGFNLLGKKFPDEIQGQFKVESNIEIGAGIGFSAALCVVIGRWFIWKGWLREDQLFVFARQLENVFHGQSSGLDIAGAMADQIVSFKKPDQIEPIAIHWKPIMSLTYSGSPKKTAEAVSKVNALAAEQAALALSIDQQMEKSVHMIESALKLDSKQGLILLTEAIELSQNCFKQWDLITPQMKDHMEKLYILGALAVKPTGAGRGGFILALWEKEPPKDSGIELNGVYI